MTGPEFDKQQEDLIKEYGAENDSCPKCGSRDFIIAVTTRPVMFTCCNPKCYTQWVKLPE